VVGGWEGVVSSQFAVTSFSEVFFGINGGLARNCYLCMCGCLPSQIFVEFSSQAFVGAE
jgi:hypothetical protein